MAPTVPFVVRCNQDTGDRVGEALKEISASFGVIALVLMKNGGQGEDDEVVSIGFVEEAAPIISAEAWHALPELRMRIRSLSNHGSQANEDEGGIVEGVFGGDDEGLLGSGRRSNGAGTDGAEIRHDTEDALGLGLRGIGSISGRLLVR